MSKHGHFVGSKFTADFSRDVFPRFSLESPSLALSEW
jgi:hypothetical protein